MVALNPFGIISIVAGLILVFLSRYLIFRHAGRLYNSPESAAIAHRRDFTLSMTLLAIGIIQVVLGALQIYNAN